MKKPPLREQVEVVAHTRLGFIAPDIIIWKQRRYNVMNIVKRKRLRKWRERIVLDVMTSKRMELEFDYRDKTWLLMELEPDPF